jgi:hypothetical protein
MLALDPGGTTGWHYSDGDLTAHGEIYKQNHHKELFDFLVQAEDNRVATPLHVVCERFEFRKNERDRDKIDYIAGQYEGVVKLFCQQFKGCGVKLIMQSASHTVGRKAFFGDGPEGNEKMKQLGLYFPGERHATDAARHYAYYRTFTLKDSTFLLKLK